MSSQEDLESDHSLAQNRPSRKKRRMRACDMCRRRKVRCDGGLMPHNICSNCITFKYKCTYVQSAPKRLPDAGYIECLETQMTEMRTLLNKYRQLCPNIELAADLNRINSASSPFIDIPMSSLSTTDSSPQPGSSTLAQPPALSPATPLMTSMSPGSPTDIVEEDPDVEPSDDEVYTRKSLTQVFQDMHISAGPDHYLGKSSSMMFLQAALDVKKEFVVGSGTAELQDGKGGIADQAMAGSVRKGKERALPTDDISEATKKKDFSFPFELRRPALWQEHPWVQDAMKEDVTYIYPPADLISALVDIYFTHFNIHTPLLHRPTFEQNIKDGLHLRNPGFGASLLLVCALGSKFSNDTRVLLDSEREKADRWEKEHSAHPDEEDHRWHSAGWKWFMQVHQCKKSMSLSTPSVYDLQVLYLASVYVHGTSNGQVAWTYIGHGLRVAQNMGLHRKKVYHTRPSVEEELMKRAFWSLFYMDRALSSVLGRPCAIQDEDFDVDLPIACDDEYWLHPDPEQAFKQPEDKPSTVDFFNCLLRLSQIHAFALRTIYSINKSKALLGLVGPDWQQRIVAEIDSSLNRWIDNIPPHLRWDPHMENTIFLDQSALLYSTYYTVQITVHRPFIPSPRKPSLLSFPSLAICTNAARSCIHVLDTLFRRTGLVSYIYQYALFCSAIVLLLNIWGGKRSGSSADPLKEIEDVHKAMHIVKALEPRWYTAGRVWDILYDLANVGDLPLPERRPAHKKRPHWGVHESPADRSASTAGVTSPMDERHLAGSKRVQQYQQTHSPIHVPPSTSASAYSLPIHSDELGRLPLHPLSDSQGVSSSTIGNPWMPRVSAAAQAPAVTEAAPAAPSIFNHDTPMAPPIDPALEAIFSMLSPVQYQQAMCPSGTSGGPPPAAEDMYNFMDPRSFSAIIGMNLDSVMNNVNSAGQLGGDQPRQAQQEQQQSLQQPTDSDTLAIWSAAPSGFEWDDWGTYVTNFNGMVDPRSRQPRRS